MCLVFSFISQSVVPFYVCLLGCACVYVKAQVSICLPPSKHLNVVAIVVSIVASPLSLNRSIISRYGRVNRRTYYWQTSPYFTCTFSLGVCSSCCCWCNFFEYEKMFVNLFVYCCFCHNFPIIYCGMHCIHTFAALNIMNVILPTWLCYDHVCCVMYAKEVRHK